MGDWGRLLMGNWGRLLREEESSERLREGGVRE